MSDEPQRTALAQFDLAGRTALVTGSSAGIGPASDASRFVNGHICMSTAA